MAQVENETQAKQGDTGRSTLTALIVGLVVVVIAAVGVLSWQGAKSPEYSNPSQKAAGENKPD